jgi:para-nitrobenzyl esterase
MFALQFMRTGSPNGKWLTPWADYTSANGETTILDDVCEVKNTPDREAPQALPAI